MIGFPYDSQVIRYDEDGTIELDRAVKSDVYRQSFMKFFNNGVFANPSDNFQVLVKENMSLTVKKGYAFIQGVFAIGDTEETISLDKADGLDRIDRIVIRHDDNLAVRAPKIVVIKGTPNGNPQAPDLVRTETQWDICLADVLVKAGAIKLTQDRVTDQRLNSEVCGVVTCTIDQVDTTTIFEQYQSALDNYLNLVDNSINGTMAGYLENLIKQEVNRAMQKENDLTNKYNELSSRMDSFTQLQEGSTTGDAELIDGRVGYDGKTYENIGDAIRGQVSQLSDEIDFISSPTKNKWDMKSGKLYGVTFNVLKDGGISIEGTATNNIFFRQRINHLNGLYCLSVKSINGGYEIYKFNVRTRNLENNLIQDIQITNAGDYENVKDGDIDYIEIGIVSGTVVNDILYIQLEEGNVKTDFIPPITAIDYVSREFVNDLSLISSYTKNKWLMKSGRLYGVTFNVLKDGGISIEGTATNNIFFRQRINHLNGLYCLSVKSINGGYEIYKFNVRTRNLENNLIQDIQITNAGDYENVKDGDIDYIEIGIVSGTVVNDILYIQLEEGNVKTDFIPPITATDYVSREFVNDLSSLEKYVYENKYKTRLFSVFHTVGVIGDSLASGQNRVDDPQHYHDFYDYSWVQCMKRELGNTMYNFTKSGLSTRTWLTDDMGLRLLQSTEKCQCYIIALGANDIGLGEEYIGTPSDIDLLNYNNNADTFYGNYAKIIQIIKEKEPRAKIFTFENPCYGIYDMRVKFNNVVKYMETIFDNVYNISFDEDFFNSQESFMKKNNLYGHYTPLGYQYVASHFLDKLSCYMYDNYLEFTKVELIGTDFNDPF